MCHAYLEMEVEKQSRPFLTINTTHGLYQYQRLLYGVASALAIWQRTVDKVLQGTLGVSCYLDDIIVMGRTMEEHLEWLVAMLRRLEEYGFKVNQEKCKFLGSSLEYLGHHLCRRTTPISQERKSHHRDAKASGCHTAAHLP